MKITANFGARRFGVVAAAALAVGSVTVLAGATSSSAASLAPASKVVASWDFNQVSGVITDLQADGDDLTLSGPWSSVAGKGSDPSAVRFSANPSAASTSVANGQNFNPGTGSFALTVVFRATKDVTSGSPNIAQHGSFNDTGQIKVQLDPGGKAGCRIKGDRATYLFYHPTASINDNKWHTITCARNATDVTVTLDGVSFSPAGTEDPGTIAVSDQPFRFAQKVGPGSAPDQFIGDIGFASYSA
jgi:Laminin G domain